MDRKQHSNILGAYLHSLRKSDAEAIMKAIDNCFYAGANLGNSSQLAAADDLSAVIATVVDRMIDHDLNNIERVVKRESQ